MLVKYKYFLQVNIQVRQVNKVQSLVQSTSVILSTIECKLKKTQKRVNEKNQGEWSNGWRVEPSGQMMGAGAWM